MSFGGGGFNPGTNAFNTPQSAPFGMTMFGNQSPGFGGGSSTSLFNSTPSTPSTGGLFGNNNPSSQLSGFGQNTGGFGGSGGLSPFGGSGTTVFGQGSSSGISPDGSQGTYGRTFERVPENADGAGNKCYMMCISAMRDFTNIQPEMLRSADYKKGHKRASGQVQNPSSQFGSSTGFGAPSSGGFGSGFRSSTFGQSGTSIFSGSPGGGGFGSSFGQNTSTFSSTGFGSSLGGGATGTSMFGSGTSGGFGQSGSSIFGQPTSTGGSLFGNAQPSSFGGGFLPSSSSPPGLFGTSTGSASIFGQNATPFGSTSGFAGTGLFGSQSSSGFTFGNPPTGSVFGNPASSVSMFGQSTPSNLFGGFSQSTPFGTQSQPQSNLFSNVASSAPAGSLFGSSQPMTGQMTPTGGYFTGNKQWQADPSMKPNWTPEYGLVIPDAAEFLKFDENSSKVNAFDYVRRDKEQSVTNRYVSIPIKFALDDPAPEKKEKSDLGWEAFSLSRPVKTTLEDEIKESIESFRAGDAPVTTGEHAPAFSFLSPSPDPQYDRNVQALMELERERQNRTKSVDGLSLDQIKSLLPTIKRADYYIQPTLEGLEFLVTTQGKDALKSVPGVEIGRSEYGKVCFAAPINLEKMDVNAAVIIKRGRVCCGEDPTMIVGIPATITLYKVFSKDKGVNGFLRLNELAEEIDRIKKFTITLRAEFVSYDKHGTWVMRVSEIGM